MVSRGRSLTSPEIINPAGGAAVADSGSLRTPNPQFPHVPYVCLKHKRQD